jgi:integration host factor subunit beta
MVSSDQKYHGDSQMVRSELIAKLAAANPHLAQKDVTAVTNAIFDSITETISRGGRVELRGFGAFTAKQREPRVGRNPRTGDAVEVDAKQVAAFRASKNLHARINQGR